MSRPHDTPQLYATDTQQVLVDYLDQLLNDSPQDPVMTALNTMTNVEVVSSLTVAEAETVVNVVVQEPAPMPAQQGVPSIVIADAPPWAQQNFQVLLFKVSGLTLAVPLQSLNGILEWNGANITEMPGHAEYFLGVLPERDKQIKVVDTAALVVPSKFRQGHCRENLQKIILIGDGEWGLACDSVAEVINLAPEGVRWRSSRGLRAWLAGTVIEQMCALLDIDKFVDLLASERLQVAE